jgi:hypothetical protein
MTSRWHRRNEDVGATHEKVAEAGVITDEFQHGEIQRRLFAVVMGDEIERIAGYENPAILEAAVVGVPGSGRRAY